MEQYQELELWYGSRKEPNIKIEILRDIAINGKRTKPELRDSLGYADTTIANTLSIDEKSDIEKRMFWRNGTKKINKYQNQYSLTIRSMFILTLCKYKDNKLNRKQNIVGKPYLNLDEFRKFVSIFEKEHSYTYKMKNGHEITISLEQLMLCYFSSNPSIAEQLISESNNNELQKFISEIKSDEVELQRIEKEKERVSQKIESDRFMMNRLLSSILISSLKK